VSSTARGGKRNESDYYPTPAWCVDRFHEKTQLPPGDWVEPCAGHGDIISAFRNLRGDINWTANEIRTDTRDKLEPMADEVHIGDFLSWQPPKRYKVSASNPPFSLAMPVILKSLEIADWVVMLLRLNYVGSDVRNEFFQTMMPDVYVLPERPSFDGKGTDSIEYAWFVWGPEGMRRRDKGYMQVLNGTPLEIRKAQKPLDLRLPDNTQANLF
jgi:hypothetical protein